MKKYFWLLTWAIVLVTAGRLIYWSSVNRITENFHEVVPGVLYRSAQLFPNELEDVVKSYGIKTVINLRGAHPESDWYLGEHKKARELGVELVDIGMGTKHVPHKDKLIHLLQAYRHAKSPILVHCRVGADRTGEAVALYLLEILKKTPAEALESLSLKYWHLPITAPAKMFFVNQFKGYDWAVHKYDPCSPEFLPFYSSEYCQRAY